MSWPAADTREERFVPCKHELAGSRHTRRAFGFMQARAGLRQTHKKSVLFHAGTSWPAADTQEERFVSCRHELACSGHTRRASCYMQARVGLQRTHKKSVWFHAGTSWPAADTQEERFVSCRHELACGRHTRRASCSMQARAGLQWAHKKSVWFHAGMSWPAADTQEERFVPCRHELAGSRHTRREYGFLCVC